MQAFTVHNRVIRIRDVETQQVKIERPALFTLCRRLAPNKEFKRVRTTSFPYAQAMFVWHEEVNTNPLEYRLKPVNSDDCYEAR